MTTLGAHSLRLAAVRALRTKAGRREQGRFTLEGATMLREALGAGLQPDAVYATPAGLESIEAQRAALEGRLFGVTDGSMRRLSDLETPPGVLAVFPALLDDLTALLANGDPAVVLAGVADPGNAGTLLRSAELFGIRRAIFTRDAVEPHNPKTVRATMGALFRMHIAVADGAALARAARQGGYVIVAAATGGVALPTFHFPARSLIAIGNERHGVCGSLPHVDLAVAIPQYGGGDSLNASVAGGIIFYAFSQQVFGKISAS